LQNAKILCLCHGETEPDPDLYFKYLKSLTRRVMNVTRARRPGAGDPRCEMDSHADTCVAGSNTLLISETSPTASTSITNRTGAIPLALLQPLGLVQTAAGRTSCNEPSSVLRGPTQTHFAEPKPTAKQRSQGGRCASSVRQTIDALHHHTER
jgi:hypothetical protein